MNKSAPDDDLRHLQVAAKEVVDSILRSEIPGHESGRILRLPNAKVATTADTEARRELVDKFNEIGLRTVGEDSQKITEELIAVRATTEQATVRIIENLESIELLLDTLGNTDDPPFRTIRDKIVGIYESSAFQDLTGQHIGKIIRLLDCICFTIDGIHGVLGDKDSWERYSEYVEQREQIVDPGELLEGPQVGTHKTSQAEIDRLFD